MAGFGAAGGGEPELGGTPTSAGGGAVCEGTPAPRLGAVGRQLPVGGAKPSGGKAGGSGWFRSPGIAVGGTTIASPPIGCGGNGFAASPWPV